MFNGLLQAYERGLESCAEVSLVTLCIFFATVALSVYLFNIIPKGFLSQQDTAPHQRIIGDAPGYLLPR